VPRHVPLPQETMWIPSNRYRCCIHRLFVVVVVVVVLLLVHRRDSFSWDCSQPSVTAGDDWICCICIGIVVVVARHCCGDDDDDDDDDDWTVLDAIERIPQTTTTMTKRGRSLK